MKQLLTLLLLFSFFSSCIKKEKKITKSLARLDYEKANALLNKNHYDSAFYYYNKVISSNTDSLLTGKSLFNMAIIQSDQGDYFGSYETAVKSITYFDRTDNSYLATTYNTIAINKTNLKEYHEAIKWYQKAILAKSDYKNRLMWKNNLAVAYYKDQNYLDAKAIYLDLLQNDSVKNENILLTKVIDNFSNVKWLENPKYNAAPEFLKALHIREKENDLWGQNASYAHLADYYTKKQPDSALFYANKMYQVAQKIKSPDDQIEALQKLIKLSPPKETRQYFEIYQNLNDSIQTARNAAKNQFALIRYETEKSKADNLVLQKDNDEKKYQIIILAFGILLLAVAGILWYRKRKQRLELEAENTIRENKLKTSRKIHDVVANGLYRIMTKLDHQETLKDDPIVNEIEELYEKSRDISYEKPEPVRKHFHNQISDLFTSFETENIKLHVTGNTTTLWQQVSETAKSEIEHIMQELLINMKKHSNASNVNIEFERMNDHVHVRYTDDGVGIADDVKFNNGLTNTGTRIKNIRGKITFDTNVEKGLKILISFPVH